MCRYMDGWVCGLADDGWMMGGWVDEWIGE